MSNYTTATDAIGAWRETLFNGEPPRLYSFGCDGLNSIPLGPGRIVLLGGAPGTGKSALAMQLTVDGLRSTPDLRAVVCSVEMSTAVLLDRQLARLSGVSLSIIAARRLTAEHREPIDRGIATLMAVGDRLAFVGEPHDLATVADVADDFGGELILLDYIQRITPPKQAGDKRSSIDATMNVLRRFASAGRAVLVVSAVARGKNAVGQSSYGRGAIGLASFKESGELEYGTNSAYLLGQSTASTRRIDLRCMKNRDAEPKDIALDFDRPLQRFTEAEPTPAGPMSGCTGELVELWNATPAKGSE
jgi:replicative DNA helicase